MSAETNATPFKLNSSAISELTNLNIYPNSARDFFNIETDLVKSPVRDVIIYDELGKTIYDRTIGIDEKETIITIDCSLWPVGIYIVKLNSAEGIVISKVIVNHRNIC